MCVCLFVFLFFYCCCDPLLTAPPEAYTAQQCDFSAGGGSGTSEAVISVTCFSTWVDGGER